MNIKLLAPEHNPTVWKRRIVIALSVEVWFFPKEAVWKTN